MDILKDGLKLSKHIKSTLTAYASAGRRIHIAVVSAIWHACKHGDTSHLTTIYDGLRPNDQAAVRMFIRRAHIVNGLGASKKVPETMTTEELNAAHEAGQVLDFKQKAFAIVNGPNTKPAQTLLALCESRLINPDGETDKYVLDRNNFAEVRTLGDADVLKQIVSMKKRLATESDRLDVHVSKKVRELIDDFADKADTMLKQFSLSNNESSENRATH